MTDFNITRGNQETVIEVGDSKANKAARLMSQVLMLKSMPTTRRDTIPSQHYKFTCSTVEDTEASFQMLQSFRFNNPQFDKVEIRKDPVRKVVYLWHNAERVRKARKQTPLTEESH